MIDRTLHMLGAKDREKVLRKHLELSKPGTHVLIADERSNMPAFKATPKASRWNWTKSLERRGFLFVHRD